MPELSIIVPAYNAEKYLNQCVESILIQSFENFELILINDGSTDNSLNICNEFAKKDKRVRLINQENQGIAKTIVNGIKLAKGKYIGFVDSDDWIDEKMYYVLINSIKIMNADLIQSGTLIDGKTISENLTSEKEWTLEDCKNSTVKPFFETKADLYPLTASRWNKVYKKVLLEEIVDNLDTSVAIGEDLIMNLNYLTLCKKVVVLKGENNYFYRNHNQSTTKKVTLKRQQALLRLPKELKKLAKVFNFDNGAIDEFEKNTICSLMLDTLLSNISNNEKLENIKYLYDLLNDKNHIKEYSKKRPLIAKIVLFLLRLKLFKLLVVITDIFKT